MNMKAKRYPPIFQSVPSDEFTDREELIGRLCEMATDTPRDRTFSTAIARPLGQDFRDGKSLQSAFLGTGRGGAHLLHL